VKFRTLGELHATLAEEHVNLFGMEAAKGEKPDDFGWRRSVGNEVHQFGASIHTSHCSGNLGHNSRFDGIDGIAATIGEAKARGAVEPIVADNSHEYPVDKCFEPAIGATFTASSRGPPRVKIRLHRVGQAAGRSLPLRAILRKKLW